MNITVCGGGNEGHVVAGYLASHGNNKVSLFTSQPRKWNNIIEISDINGELFKASLDTISNKPQDVIPAAEIVIICVPGYAMHNVLSKIAPYLNKKAWVGTIVSSTGFFFEAFNLLPKQQPIFGFQRVPFITRIIEYGHKAELKGYKKSLSIAVEQANDKETIRRTVEELFETPTLLLDSYKDVVLSNSNPLLHTTRIYSLWKDWKPGVFYDNVPQFYWDWTIETSELLLKMDEEFQTLLRAMGVKPERVPSLLSYYECDDAVTLTNKLRSIPAFNGILAPMVETKSGQYEPDISSRYFQEDIPYGMKFIVEMAEQYRKEIPHIRMVYDWGMSIKKHQYRKE